MAKTKLAIIILVILAFQSLLLVHADSGTAQIVDPLGSQGRLALDSQGNPHIIYINTTVSGSPFHGLKAYSSLNYAYKIGQDWNLQTVDSTGFNGIVLALDASNNPHILYNGFDPNGNLLKYAFWNGENWTLQTFIASGAGSCVMALDASGNPHLAYSTSTGNYPYTATLVYTTYDGSNWAAQTIATQISNQSYSLTPNSIVLDSNGYPHILFSELSVTRDNASSSEYYTYNIKYASWTGSTWNIQDVAANTASAGNIILDSKDQPHICYVHEDRTYNPTLQSYSGIESICYAYWDGSAWQSQIVEAQPSYYGYEHPTLFLDSNGNPQIFYYKTDYQNIQNTGCKEAQPSEAGWNIQTINTHDFSDLTIDSKGNLHATYDVGMGNLQGTEIYGNLTYTKITSAAIKSPLQSSSPFPVLQVAVPLVTAIFILIIIRSIYKSKHKKTSAQLVDESPSA
jgi:hypothetical protein